MAILLGVSASNQRREAPGRLLSASVESQMHSSQKNPCAKVSYFGVPYLVPFNSQQYWRPTSAGQLRVTACQIKMSALLRSHSSRG